MRQSHAHSWVEAYLGREGWVTLDATPPDLKPFAGSLFTNVDHFVDFLRMRWYRYVVNFGFADQYQLIAAFRRPALWFDRRFWRTSTDSLREWLSSNWGRWVALSFLLFAFIIGLSRWRKAKNRKIGDAHSRQHEATHRYLRLLELLKKVGFVKKQGATPEEFRREVEMGVEGPVTEFTSLYQRARFSGNGTADGCLQRMDEILRDLHTRKAHP